MEFPFALCELSQHQDYKQFRKFSYIDHGSWHDATCPLDISASVWVKIDEIRLGITVRWNEQGSQVLVQCMATGFWFGRIKATTPICMRSHSCRCLWFQVQLLCDCCTVTWTADYWCNTRIFSDSESVIVLWLVPALVWWRWHKYIRHDRQCTANILNHR